MDDVDRLTIPDYNLLLEAYNLQAVDREYQQHVQAFLTYKVQAQKPSGKYKTKPVYNTFKKFFDYEKALEEAKNKKTKQQKERFSGIGKLLKKGGA
jgi:hypothetical protein